MPVLESVSGVSDAITAKVSRDLEAAMSDYMTEKQAEIRTMISVPVQYSAIRGLAFRGVSKPRPIGPLPGPGALAAGRATGRITRSKTGEPPRKEFGNYYESMKVVVRNEGDKIVGVLGTDIKDGRAPVLEFTLNRPHFRTIYARMRSDVISGLKGYLASLR